MTLLRRTIAVAMVTVLTAICAIAALGAFRASLGLGIFGFLLSSLVLVHEIFFVYGHTRVNRDCITIVT